MNETPKTCPATTVDEFIAMVNTRSLLAVVVVFVVCIEAVGVVILLEVSIVLVVLKVPFK